VGIDKGKITQIATKIKEPAGEVIDARGHYVFPGGIDIWRNDHACRLRHSR
jgi:dihydroorotase-like cyclic amidohydrolase